MKLTKWDTLLFETSPADLFYNISGKIRGFAEVGDNKTNGPDNEGDSEKECDREEEKEEITLSKALSVVEKLKKYCLRNGFPDAHP